MKPVTCLRSWLFVPGHEERKIEHAFTSAADAVILDWEDSVLAQDKAKAREHSRKACASQTGNKLILVRINSNRSEWFAEDLRQLASVRPGAVMLPKCESAGELHEIATYLQKEAPDWEPSLVPLVESPLGVLRVEEIATASGGVAALAFGAHDFAATTGVLPSRDEVELLMAKSRIVTVAKAYGLAAVDSPATALGDVQAVREAAERAYRLGFTGKLAIHPAQLAPIHETFAPSPEETREAEELLRHAESLQAGAFSWKGQMVDKAILEKARSVVDRFQSLSRK